MKRPATVLGNFNIIRPRYATSQAHTFDWLVAAHLRSEQTKGELGKTELEAFQQELRERLMHVGCKPGIIEFRGHEIEDFLHQRWPEMSLYRLEESPAGLSTEGRHAIYRSIVGSTFERFYPENTPAPDDLIHVSCTGYASPSGAQQVVSKKGWGHKTHVTHAYHMGCYGAIAGIRVAAGFITSGSKQADMVHTELCTLHLNPSLHTAEQLVFQSLFADGFIKYSACSEEHLQKAVKPYLKIMSIHEEIIPNSLHAMEWLVGNSAFQFTLAKEIPGLIGKQLQPYLKNLCDKAGMQATDLDDSTIFAIHPGGPKILDYAKMLLRISDDQIRHSRDILRRYGNMSSATLPHVWQSICADESIPSGTKVVSLAFGPGLTIAGAILEKRS